MASQRSGTRPPHVLPRERGGKLTAWTPRTRAATLPAGLLLSSEDIDRLFPAHLLTDDQHTVLAVGPSLRRLTGDTFLGRGLQDIFQVDTQDPCDLAGSEARPLTLVAASPRPLDLRGTSLRHDGYVWFLVGHQPYGGDLLPEDFGPYSVGEHQASAALSEQKLAAEAADRAKTTFLATMSHEIRTPMNGVLGLASLLARTDLDYEQRQLLDVMIQSGHALMDILNDVLDLSKVELGRTEVECVAFSISDLLTSLDAMFRPQASGKCVELLVKSEAIPRMMGDPSRIRQILLNLLGNAIKFTEAGTVHLRASYRHRRSRGSHLILVVSDSGIGIAPGSIERIFQPFLQADSSTTRKFGGTGLGLAITRRLVELLEGTIAVESRLGVGSTFTVTLPMQLAVEELADPDLKSSEAIALPDLSGAGHRVLLVEDNQTNQFLMMRMLEKLGLEADCTANGRDAIAAWQNASYDLILMDVEMPILDGLEATREIRRRESGLSARGVPIFALSAENSAAAAHAAIDAGMDKFITKPITFDSLSFALAEVLLGRDR